jgi:putative membrane protein
MKLFSHWLVAAIAIVVTAFLVPGSAVTIPGAFIAAVVLGILNISIRPILLILTLPISIVTLGLFSLVINALMILLASAIVPGFAIPGFVPAFLFAIVLSLVNWFFARWSGA